MIRNAQDREWVTPGFSAKEKAFLLEYARNPDLQEACRKAGFDEHVVSFRGEVILKKEGAKQELALIREELGLDSNEAMGKEEVAREFRIIATASVQDFYDEFGNVKDVTELDPEKARAIKEVKRSVHPRTGVVTVTLTLHDKVAALQNLGRISGAYAADNDQAGAGDVNIQIVVPGGLGGL